MKHKDADESIESSRRKFIKKAGKLAVYTPPAMALMMQPSHAHFQRSGGIVDLREKLREYENEHPEWESFFDRLWKWLNSHGDE